MVLEKIPIDLDQSDHLFDLTAAIAPEFQSRESSRCASPCQDESKIKNRLCPSVVENQSIKTNSKIEKTDKDKKNRNKRTVFQCNLCQLIVKCKETLQDHRKRDHKNVLRCNSKYCASYFITEADRQQHELSAHAKCGKCIYCGALFSNRIRWLHEHVQKFHKEAVQCDFPKNCPEYFHTQTEKDEHIFKVHQKAAGTRINKKYYSAETCSIYKPEQCIYCGKIFKQKFSLSAHIRNSHLAIRIKCRFHGCGLYFLSNSESDEHFRQEHQEMERLKKFHCPKCSYKTAFNSSLQNHIRCNHTIRVTLQCNKCQRSFSEQGRLNRHVRAAHGTHFTCEHCGKNMQKVSLENHFQKGWCKAMARENVRLHSASTNSALNETMKYGD